MDVVGEKGVFLEQKGQQGVRKSFFLFYIKVSLTLVLGRAPKPITLNRDSMCGLDWSAKLLTPRLWDLNWDFDTYGFYPSLDKRVCMQVN